MNSTLIAAFENRQAAESLAAYLQNQNIHATFVDLTVSMPGNALPADFAKYQVRVPEPDAPAAVQATSHTDTGVNLMLPAIRCPECGSVRVRYPEMPRNFVLPFLFRILVKSGVVRGAYACLTCKHEWSPGERRKAS
jgi:DNA-directed RNA polymerase subunit RPC12/RpoP